MLGLGLLPACAEELPSGPDISVYARAVEIAPTQMDGLRLRGTVSLDTAHPAFGGFSGLSVEAGRMTAVTDAGWWLVADLAEVAEGLVPVAARLSPMVDQSGNRLDKAGGDAEGLTVEGGQLLISFERDHRVMVGGPGARLGDHAQDRSFEKMGTNQGLEALATLTDGTLLAIGEQPLGGGNPMFRITRNGQVTTGQLPQRGPFFVTGADMGPDERLYVLMRDYSVLRGVRIQILRYAIGEDGFPDTASAHVLARFESSSGIDNMEGISLWTDALGRVRLTLISDDNFNFMQRTVLMDFEVIG